jgi:poly(A)-specific ribonuclease
VSTSCDPTTSISILFLQKKTITVLSGFGLIRVAVSHEGLTSALKVSYLPTFFVAVSFLLKNKFRFDLPFSDGIAYLSRKEEAQIRASWAVRDAERAALEDMVLKVDDKPLIDHIHRSVQNWLSQPLVEREDYLNIPHTTEERPRIKHLPAALSRYQIRLTHQIIRKDYIDLKTLGRDGFVRITIRNEREDEEQKLRQEQHREQDVIQAIEFRWVIEALCGGDISKIPERCFLAALPGESKPNDDDAPYRRFVDNLQRKLSTRRRVLFGHNCFTDLIYLYACFIGEPPEKVEDFQELIHRLFPAVVDTKYLASLVNKLKFSSNLQALEKEMRVEEVPHVEVPAAFDRYVYGEHFHEAGFDSFMTAKIAVKLSAKLEREERLREARKPQKVVKAGKTILMDLTADTEDEEQTEEYVTASESAETESVMSSLASKLSGVFSAPSDPTSNIS